MVLKIPKRLIWENLSTLLCYSNFLNWIYIIKKLWYENLNFLEVMLIKQ